MRKIFIRDFMPKDNLLPKLNRTFNLIFTRVSFDIEETVLEILGALAVGQVHIIT